MAKAKQTEAAGRLGGMDPYLKECVTLEPAAIDEEFARLPNDYAYWNEQYGKANQKFMHAEHYEKQVNARIYLTKREMPPPQAPKAAAGEKEKDTKEKKLTEGTIDAMVRTDLEMIAATEARIEAEAEKDYLRGVLDAMRTKREALVSLAANMRQEQKTISGGMGPERMENLTAGFNG